MATFWPVWHWMYGRVVDTSGDAWELLSLATAAVFLVLAKTDARATGMPAGLTHALGGQRANCASLPIVLLLIYAATYQFLPPLLRAGIAVTAIAAACSAIWFDKRMDLPLLGLMLLSLPVIASLNFYLGYPLRVVVGTATQALLQMNGFAVVREGTLLHWGGRLISIDAPCSGIKMLWAGLYLSFTLAAFSRLDSRRTILLGAIAIAAILLANVLRAAALFFVEADVVVLANEWHTGIGVIVFLFAALGVASAAHRLRVVTYAA